jgi:surface protein
MKKIYILSVLLLLSSIGVFAQSDAFITKWKPNDSNVVEINLNNRYKTEYLFSIDWDNDGTYDDENITNVDKISHEYSDDELKVIKIKGKFPYLSKKDIDGLKEIVQWGTNEWGAKSMEGLFGEMFGRAGFMNTTITATDAPDLSKVTSMYCMFAENKSFNQDISGWNVSNVTNMRNMFEGAESFNQDLNGWDVSNVIDMSYMFGDTPVFNGKINDWDVSSVKYMNFMFGNTKAFNQDLNKWDVSSVVSSEVMFYNADAFNGDISAWKTTSLVTVKSMFEGAKAFNQDISGWDMSDVIDMYSMFSRAESFNQNISKWDVSNVTKMRFMFNGAKSFNQDISKWNISNVTDMGYLFANTDEFNQDISGWDMSNVVFIDHMFYRAKAFNQNVGKWNTDNVKHLSNIFYEAESFNQDLNNWNVSKVEDFEGVFKGAKVFNSNISNWNVESATSMRSMFEGATKFNQDISKWNVAKVKNFSDMFKNAIAFNSDIGSWITSEGVRMSSMFMNAKSFNADISKWDVSKAYFMAEMFRNAVSFNCKIQDWNIGDAYWMSDMFKGVKIPTETYDQILIKWAKVSPKNGRVKFNAGNSYYSEAAAEARQTLKWSWQWTIIDLGKEPDNIESNPLIITFQPKEDKCVYVNTVDGLEYKYHIDWNNDGVYDETNIKEQIIHLYEDTKPKVIRIVSEYPAINSTNCQPTEINQWGDIKWKSFKSAFENCETIKISAEDTPDLSQVTDMSKMFSGVKSFEGDISKWDITNITSMDDMFKGVTLSTEDYDQILINWSKLDLKEGVKFNAGNTYYSEKAKEAHDILVNKFKWNITDLGMFEKSIKLTSPKGGEQIKKGSTFTITWTSANITGNIKIELLKDSGNPVVIADNVDVSIGSYEWSVDVDAGDNYSIKITSADNNFTDKSTATFSIVTISAIDNLSVIGAKIYPNPVTDILNIELPTTGSYIVTVLNSIGDIVTQQTVSSVYTAIDMSAYNSGIYIIKVTTGNRSYTGKIIKQ